jgi:hypothetical protein
MQLTSIRPLAPVVEPSLELFEFELELQPHAINARATAASKAGLKKEGCSFAQILISILLVAASFRHVHLL